MMKEKHQQECGDGKGNEDGVQGAFPRAVAVASFVKTPADTTVMTTNNDESFFSEIPLEIEEGSTGGDDRGVGTSAIQLQLQQQQQLKVLRRIKDWTKVAVILLLVLVIVFCVYLFRTQDSNDNDDEQEQQSAGANGYNHYDGPYVDPYYEGGGGGWIDDNADMEPYMHAAEQCNVPPYTGNLDLYPCHEIVPGHPNSFWYNELFLCRVSHRPCDGGVDYEHNPGDVEVMDLGSDIIRFPVIDPGEVWIFTTDRNGQPITQTSDSCSRRFYSEGYWRSVLSGSHDFNDYLFNSLICCEPEDDNVRTFVVIDGVLVDSCPKKYSQNCRLC